MSIIREKTEHLTLLDAKANGEAFKSAWGRGYEPEYSVYCDASKNVWVCDATRCDNCE